MKYDLAELTNGGSHDLRILRISATTSHHSSLTLDVMMHSHGRGPFQGLRFARITCTNAVDYAIRPKDPNCIEGGPVIEMFAEHPLLQNPGLQDVPGGDGEEFQPPLQLKLLVLDQSHIIAERFEIEEC